MEQEMIGEIFLVILVLLVIMQVYFMFYPNKHRTLSKVNDWFSKPNLGRDIGSYYFFGI